MRKTVLIVEDNTLVTELFRSCLKQLGCDVVHTRTGSQARKLDLPTSPDLIILNITLPGNTGYEVIQALRTSGQLGNAQVIAVSSTADEDDLVRMERLGFSAFVSKPINVQRFMTIARRFLADPYAPSIPGEIARPASIKQNRA
jgi:two-component system cell cycle response regulator DivK